MSPERRIVVVGGGGHARSVIDAIAADGFWSIAGIVDPDPSVTYRGIPVLGADGILEELRENGIVGAALGVGYLGGGGGPRPRILGALRALGYALPPIVDPSSVIAADAAIGKAAFVGKLAVVNSSASIGAGAIINTCAIVEHGCTVGELAHVSVNATLCGGVTVGREAIVGAGATVLQGVSIGECAIVGAGSVVLSDVPAGATVVGVFNGR